MSTRRWLLAFASAGLLVACGDDDVVEAPEAPTAQAMLTEGNTFLADPATSRVMLHLTIGRGEQAHAFTFEAPVTGGVAVGMIEDGDLWVDELTLTHEDVLLPLGMGEVRGLPAAMAELELRGAGALRFPDTVWSDDGELAMTAEAGGLVTLAWQIRIAGTPVARYEATTMIETAAMVLSDADEVELLVAGDTNEVTWRWGEV